MYVTRQPCSRVAIKNLNEFTYGFLIELKIRTIALRKCFTIQYTRFYRTAIVIVRNCSSSNVKRFKRFSTVVGTCKTFMRYTYLISRYVPSCKVSSSRSCIVIIVNFENLSLCNTYISSVLASDNIRCYAQVPPNTVQSVKQWKRRRVEQCTRLVVKFLFRSSAIKYRNVHIPVTYTLKVKHKVWP